ncbi:hypothetical protein [Pseudomonas sp. HLT2-19-2]
MKELTLKEIKALPKGTGNLFAKTKRWETSDPRSTIDTQDVRVSDNGDGTFDVIAVVEEGHYFTSVIFEIPKSTASGEHDLGPKGIGVRYFVAVGDDEENYRAISGKINLVVDSAGTKFEASEFRFIARIGSSGNTAEVHLGRFSISS